MKTCMLFLLLFGVVSMFNVRQGQADHDSQRIAFQDSASKNTRLPLRLSTEILKQAYCEQPDPEMGTLRLLLLLRFTNVGDEKVILYKGSSEIPQFRVSETPEAAASGHFELDIQSTIIESNESVLAHKGGPDPNLFVNLQPKDSHETVASVSIPIARDKPMQAAISPGSHYLQIVVWTWPGAREDAERLSKEWRGKGTLWSSNLTSESMLFAARHGEAPGDCECKDVGIAKDTAIALVRKDVLATYGPLGPYKIEVLENGCEWDVIYEISNRRSTRITLRYIIDKQAGKILFKQRV